MGRKLATYKEFRKAEIILEKMWSSYSNTQYQNITGDMYFKHVPYELWNLWYKPYATDGSLSLFNAEDRLTAIAYDIDVEEVISDFKKLEEELAYQFSKL